MSIVTEYLSLTQKYKAEYGEKTILLMQVGSFFEVYALIKPDGTYTGSNIIEFTKINDLAIANKNSSIATSEGSLPVVMAGFGTAYRDKYIQKTQEHEYTIVIHEQDPADKTKRPLTEIISPGTFFPIETDNENLSNNIMCIWLHKSNMTKKMPSQVTLGIANIDIYTGKTSLFQFSATYSHSPATYDELERYISAYKPSECIFVANIPERLVDDIRGFVGLEGAKIHKGGSPPDPHGGSPPHPPGFPSTEAAVGKNEMNATAEAVRKNEMNASAEGGVGACHHGGVGGFPPGASPHKNAEKQTYQLEVFKQFYPHLSNISEMFPTHYIATQAFCFLLDFVYQHNPNLVKNLAEPIFENYTDRLILANHSLNQLNIIDDNRHTGKMRSISSFLNNCVTTMGKRQFLYQLHYPITNESVLQASYDITAHLLQAQHQAQQTQHQAQQTKHQAQQTQHQAQHIHVQIRQQLSTISDLEKFTRKVVTKKILPKNLSSLVADLEQIVTLYKQTQSDQVLMKYLAQTISEINSIQEYSQAIIADITRVFNLAVCQNLSDITEETHIINKGVSPSLDLLIKDSLDGRDKLEAICKYLSGVLQAADTKKTASNVKTQYIKIHETAKNPPVLIGTSLRVKKLKELLQKKTVTLTYQSKYSSTVETFELDLQSLDSETNGGSKNDLVITNIQIEQITRSHEVNKTKLVRAMEGIFQEYLTDFAKYDRSLQQVIQYTTTMDVLQCKCYIAYKYNYCKPTIASNTAENKSFFALTGIRHPLIEHLQTNELYVTNDLSMGGNPPQPPLGETPTTPLLEGNTGGSFKVKSKGGFWGVSPHPHGILLYGTNAVGKTSFIKSVGIAIIMAQAGLYVPCTTFTYKPYQSIFTRILGNDNLFKGLSTFAVEMTELRTILLLANKNSLVLGDELCSGTESDSALSIFTAGLEILHERDSTFLFATHFHEINKYEEIKALKHLQMMHMAVHYDKKTNALVYDRKLRAGPGESMYGLEVCKSLHLPDAFLQRAHAIRMKYHEETQNVLSLSPTHFNAKKLVGNCEICQVNKASEVHHLQHQKNADKTKNNYITTFHKNHVANLLNICENCHQKMHQSDQQHKVVKTTMGYQLVEVANED